LIEAYAGGLIRVPLALQDERTEKLHFFLGRQAEGPWGKVPDGDPGLLL
jgi:hypothetical protein